MLCKPNYACNVLAIYEVYKKIKKSKEKITLMLNFLVKKINFQNWYQIIRRANHNKLY